MTSAASAGAAENPTGFSAPAPMPCFEFKDAFKKNESDPDPFEKADPRLQAAFFVNPFSHNWPGERSDIVFKKQKASVHVKDEYQVLASMVGKAIVQPFPVEKACLDLGNKPFFVIIDSETRKTKKVELKGGKITLVEGMHSDTYTVNVNTRPGRKSASRPPFSKPSANASSRPLSSAPLEASLPADAAVVDSSGAQEPAPASAAPAPAPLVR